MEEEIRSEFVKNARDRMDQSNRMIGICLQSLSEDEIWNKPNDSSNSIGNLIVHLCGNITQYIISSLGNKEDLRDRDKEFSSQETLSKKTLIEKLTQVTEEAKSVVVAASIKEFIDIRPVQAYSFSGIGNVLHAVEHFSYHTGQIALLTKIMKNKELGFYQDIDLNTKNKRNNGQ